MFLVVLKYSIQDVLKAVEINLQKRGDLKSMEFWTNLVMDLLQFYTRADFLQNEALKLKKDFTEYLFSEQLLKNILSDKSYLHLKQLIEYQCNKNSKFPHALNVDHTQPLMKLEEISKKQEVNCAGVSVVKNDSYYKNLSKEETECVVTEPDFLVTTLDETSISEQVDVDMLFDEDEECHPLESSFSSSAKDFQITKSTVASSEKENLASHNVILPNFASSGETVESSISDMTMPLSIKMKSRLQQLLHKSTADEMPLEALPSASEGNFQVAASNPICLDNENSTNDVILPSFASSAEMVESKVSDTTFPQIRNKRSPLKKSLHKSNAQASLSTARQNVQSAELVSTYLGSKYSNDILLDYDSSIEAVEVVVGDTTLPQIFQMRSSLQQPLNKFTTKEMHIKSSPSASGQNIQGAESNPTCIKSENSSNDKMLPNSDSSIKTVESLGSNTMLPHIFKLKSLFQQSLRKLATSEMPSVKKPQCHH